jgi:CBS-domain-containing membrane protein
MIVETESRTNGAIYSLVAKDVMVRDYQIIPQHTLVRDAARLLNRKQSRIAPVIDREGRCVGVFRPTDVFEWIDAGCHEARVGNPITCPYQVDGRLLNGDDARICMLSDWSCGFQSKVPTTGGRHTEICVRQETLHFPFGSSSGYMAKEVQTIKQQSTLFEIVLRLVNTRAEGLIVLDESDRPTGIVSATDVLVAVVQRMRELCKIEKNQARKPK